MYGDVIAEIDWSVGQILERREAGLDDQTLVLFSSDNGPWMSYGNHAGSAGPLREGKGTVLEGGDRVPFWRAGRGRFRPAPVTDCAGDDHRRAADIRQFCRRPAPSDGHRRPRHLAAAATRATPSRPHEAFYYYWDNGLDAVRSGNWKLHLPHPYQALEHAGRDGAPGAFVRKDLPLSLFDLERDPAESANVADQNHDVVATLQNFVERAREDLGDSLTGRVGKNVRPAGQL